MNYIFVGIGGILGSVTRYKIGEVVTSRVKIGFPIGTFLINISGAFLLGIVNGLGIKGYVSMLLADGFLGAYTTFSTFMYEGCNLFQNDKKLKSLIYIISSVILGVIGYFIGYSVGKNI